MFATAYGVIPFVLYSYCYTLLIFIIHSEVIQVYLHQILIAYIVDNLVNLMKECFTESKNNCPGCKDGKKSPILHLHLQLGLKDILELYLHASTVKVDVLLEDLLMKFAVLFS